MNFPLLHRNSIQIPILVLSFLVLSSALADAAASDTVIDWSKGANQSTDTSCGDFTFTHMQDHKSYMLFVRGKDRGTCVFKADGLTFLYPPNFSNTTQGTRTVFSFVRFGSDVLISWIPGY
jgi:hypothetical protein